MRFSRVWKSERVNGTRHRACVLVVLAGVLACTGAADAVPRVAIVGLGSDWCQLLINNGYECDDLPDAGPASLQGYEVVIVLSGLWTDPDGLLPEFMRSGRGVITWGRVPEFLGIDTDPTVQDLQPGYRLYDCFLSKLPAIYDTTGHPGAKVLATWSDGLEDAAIGIMRNTWDEGGQSVYLGQIDPTGPDTDQRKIFLNAVRILSNPVPTVSEWGLVILTLLLATAGSAVLVRRRTAPAPAPA